MWRDVLKNQIQVGRQKLRTDKQPLPDDEEEDCKRMFMYLVAMIEANTNHSSNVVGGFGVRLENFDEVDEETFCIYLNFFRTLNKYRDEVIEMLKEIYGVHTIDVNKYIKIRYLTLGYYDIELYYNNRMTYELRLYGNIEAFDKIVSIVERYV